MFTKTHRYQNLKIKTKNEKRINKGRTQYINSEYYSTFDALFVFDIYSYVMWKHSDLFYNVYIKKKRVHNIIQQKLYYLYYNIIICVTRRETKTKNKFDLSKIGMHWTPLYIDTII